MSLKNIVYIAVGLIISALVGVGFYISSNNENESLELKSENNIIVDINEDMSEEEYMSSSDENTS